MIYQADIKGSLRIVDGLARRAPDAQRTVLRDFGQGITAQLIVRTPIGQGPSSRRLWQRYEGSEGTGFYRITNRTPYLKWVLRGRGAIVAKRGKVLRFVIGGVVLYRKRVRAAKANPFDRPVVARARLAAPMAAHEMVSRMVRP